MVYFKESSLESATNEQQSTPAVAPAQSQGWISGWYSWYWQDTNSTTAAATTTDGEPAPPPLVMSPPSTQG